jgi:hypothetical protein
VRCVTFVVALVAALVVGGCAQTVPHVVIAPGIDPQMAPAAVEGIAREAVANSLAAVLGDRRSPNAISITAIHGGSTIAAYDAGLSWIVEFDGAFEITEGTLRHGTTRIVSRGWVQIADDFGTVLAVNFGD